MIERWARRVGAMGGGEPRPDEATAAWQGRVTRELWRSAWRAHGSELALVALLVVAASAMPWLPIMARWLSWLFGPVSLPALLDGSYNRLLGYGLWLVTILASAFCGARLGGGEAAAGTEAFALALPPTRGQRFAARFSLGLAVVVGFTVPAALGALASGFFSPSFPAGLGFWVHLKGGIIGWLISAGSAAVVVFLAAALPAYALAFGRAANARTRSAVERAGPWSALLVFLIVVLVPVLGAYVLVLIASRYGSPGAPRWVTLNDLITGLVPIALGLGVAVIATRRGYRAYRDKEAVDRPLAGDAALRGQRLARPGRRTTAAGAGVALLAVIALAWFTRPFRLSRTDHLGGAIVGRAAVVGDQAYAAMGDTLAVFSLADPSGPALIGRTTEQLSADAAGGEGPLAAPLAIEVQGGIAYVLAAGWTLDRTELRLVDVARPDRLHVLDTQLPLPLGRAMAGQPGTLYVVDEGDESGGGGGRSRPPPPPPRRCATVSRSTAGPGTWPWPATRPTWAWSTSPGRRAWPSISP